MIHPEQFSKIFYSGFTYDAYKSHLESEISASDKEISNPDTSERIEAKKINFVRMKRLDSYFQPKMSTIEIIKSINQKQNWVVISENWCGDSAQILPVIARLAFLNPLINLRIILRDKNPDFMDRYLTDGKRSIPKLIIFDDDFNQLISWGPRPKTAQMLMMRMIENDISKSERLKNLHLWYSKNKGIDVADEITLLITELHPAEPVEIL